MRDVESDITLGCVQPPPWASRSSDRGLRPPSRPAARRRRAAQDAGGTREVAPPAEFDHRMPPRLNGSSARFLPGLSAPPALPERGSHVRSAGSANTRLRSAFRVSHPRGGLTPPRTLSACSIRLTLLGFDPPELSSSPGAVSPLGARCRPAVHRGPCVLNGACSEAFTRPPLARGHGLDVHPTCSSLDAGPSVRLHGFAPLASPPLHAAVFRRDAGA